MAVISVEERSRGRTGEWTFEKRSYQVAFIVTCNDVNDGPYVVVNHVHDNGYAPIESPYSHGNDSDPQAKCVRLHPSLVKEEASKRLWLVVASYETGSQDGGKGGGQGSSKDFRDESGRLTKDPLQQYDRVSVGEQKFQRPVVKAIYRNGLVGAAGARRPSGTLCAVTNSAFVAFQPPPDRDDTRQVVRITKALAEWPDAVANSLRDTVNSRLITVRKQWELFAAQWNNWTAKLNSFTGSFEFSNGRRFWDCTLEIVIDKKEWRREFLDQGLHATFAAGGKDEEGQDISMADKRLLVGIPPLRRLTDVNGVPITEPVRLDGNGQPLAVDQPDVFLTYSVYDENDWAQLEALGFFR